MPDRALIIAAESYASATEGFTAKTLPGTLQAALAFRAWLEAKWARDRKDGEAPPQHKVYFCSDPKVDGGRRATRADILEAIFELEQDGRNGTDNLFVYFSGHGFRLKNETLHLADILVTSDYIDLRRSADCCWKLDSLIQTLRCLGSGRHLYFIDACRNEVAKAIGSGITPDMCQDSEEPSVFVLQSTIPGAPALVAGPFAKELMSGLNGAGEAKAWHPPADDSMQVNLASLLKYLGPKLADTQPVTRTVTGPLVNDETVLLNTIQPVPTSTLNVDLQTEMQTLRGQVSVKPFMGVAVTKPIAGKTLSFPGLIPAAYRVEVKVDGGRVTPPQRDEAIYQDTKLVFKVSPPTESLGMAGPAPPPPPVPPEGRLRVSVPPGIAVEILSVNRGEWTEYKESVEANLPPGSYSVRLRSAHTGAVVGRREVTVKAGQRADVTPADAWRGSVPHESIASRLPQRDGGVDFSEELGGAVTDPDLGLWLAIVGGGRILGSTGDYSKIGPLPLARFDGEAPGASPVYVIAGLPSADVQLRLALHGGPGAVTWITAKQPTGMAGLREVVARPAPGQVFLTLAVGDQPASTFASFASPNRATLVVLALDEAGQPRVAQYLVPIGHLMTHLNPEVSQRIQDRRHSGFGPLKDLQSLAMMHRAFRRRRDLAQECGRDIFEQLLFGKWVDPIGGALATYELVRRNQRQSLPEVAFNMTHFFPDLPDTAAIARLAKQPGPPPSGVPLFLDGLRALDPKKLPLPFPAGLLDHSSPWTSWRGAVEA